MEKLQERLKVAQQDLASLEERAAALPLGSGLTSSSQEEQALIAELQALDGRVLRMEATPRYESVLSRIQEAEGKIDYMQTVDRMQLEDLITRLAEGGGGEEKGTNQEPQQSEELSSLLERIQTAEAKLTKYEATSEELAQAQEKVRVLQATVEEQESDIVELEDTMKETLQVSGKIKEQMKVSDIERRGDGVYNIFLSFFSIHAYVSKCIMYLCHLCTSTLDM